MTQLFLCDNGTAHRIPARRRLDSLVTRVFLYYTHPAWRNEIATPLGLEGVTVTIALPRTIAALRSVALGRGLAG